MRLYLIATEAGGRIQLQNRLKCGKVRGRALVHTRPDGSHRRARLCDMGCRTAPALASQLSAATMFLDAARVGRAFVGSRYTICPRPPHGDVAQLGERCVRNAQVRGSNPLVSIPPKVRPHDGLSRIAFGWRACLACG